MDDGNDDSGGDGNDHVHGDDDGDEDDGEDDDVDDDGAFADDGDGHDQRSWKEFDVRACAWPAWYYLIRIYATDKFDNRARARPAKAPLTGVLKNHWFLLTRISASRAAAARMWPAKYLTGIHATDKFANRARARPAKAPLTGMLKNHCFLRFSKCARADCLDVRR